MTYLKGCVKGRHLDRTHLEAFVQPGYEVQEVTVSFNPVVFPTLDHPQAGPFRKVYTFSAQWGLHEHPQENWAARERPSRPMARVVVSPLTIFVTKSPEPDRGIVR